MAWSADILLERMTITLSLKNNSDRLCRAVAIAMISAKYVFNWSLGPSVAEKVTVGAVSDDPVVAVLQMAHPIPTIPFFSDEQVATTIPWASLAA